MHVFSINYEFPFDSTQHRHTDKAMLNVQIKPFFVAWWTLNISFLHKFSFGIFRFGLFNLSFVRFFSRSSFSTAAVCVVLIDVTIQIPRTLNDTSKKNFFLFPFFYSLCFFVYFVDDGFAAILFTLMLSCSTFVTLTHTQRHFSSFSIHSGDYLTIFFFVVLFLLFNIIFFLWLLRFVPFCH